MSIIPASFFSSLIGNTILLIMKKTTILFAAMLCASQVDAQYLPATAPETNYGPLVTATCFDNDVGTDTRSAGGSAIFGFGSSYYLNYTNVTVNSCSSTTFGAPTFYWENSAGLTGSSPLASDAVDPDVVMVSSPTSNDIWAIAVYYSPSAGAYIMNTASFTPGTGFSQMSGSVWAYPFVATAASPAHINIDSDNMGNYAIVLQLGGVQIRSFTAGTVATGPLAPTNMCVDFNIIEPDVAFLGNSANEVNIVGLRPSRNRYGAFTRNFLGTLSYSPYISPVLPSLYEPRIAAPSSGVANEYAVTVKRQYTVGTNTLTDIIYEINEAGINVANDGSTAFLPPINSNNPNVLPVLTYSYAGLGSGERINLGWWVRVLGPGPSSVPNQPTSFIGIDLDVAGAVLSDPNYYLDITNLNGLNNESSIALSGRYMDWGKSAAFTYEDGFTFCFGAEMVWKINGTGAGWKPAELAELAGSQFELMPNPATTEVVLKTDTNASDAAYTIFNQLGKTVAFGSIENGEATIPVSDWSSGVYIVQMQNNSELHTMRFVKE